MVKTDDDTVHQIWELNSLITTMNPSRYKNPPALLSSKKATDRTEMACKSKIDPVIRPGEEEIELYKKWVKG